MSEVQQWRSRASQDGSEHTYSKQLKNADNMSNYTSKKDEFENISEGDAFTKHKDKIQEYHIKDAKYRQKEVKLKKENDYLKQKLLSLNMKVSKVEEHRAQDAEALIEQEDKLSNLKGKYRKSDNPNEVVKTKKQIQALAKQENTTRAEIRKWAEGTSRIHEEVSELAPSFYEDLRKLKFHGDKAMNEVLLRQINIYIERLLDKSKEFEKLKAEKLAQNKELRAKLKTKYDDHDQLKIDAIEDYKSLYILRRKLNFYETDYIIEREETDKLKQSGTKATRTSKSIITDKKSLLNETGTSIFDNGIVTASEVEEMEVDRRNTDILAKLRERLEQTKHKDIDIQKIIEKLPQ